MSSIGSQNPWAPYDNYRDCSQGICSIYCRQYCYLIFPPPPPSDDDDSGSPFSPLIIAIIGMLTSAFLLVSYYTIVRRYCRRRNVGIGAEESPDELGRNQWQVASNGLDEAVIRTITVCKYEKGGGVVEGTECAVCLGEFQENESLRLLPKCSHAFHLPCIDKWLKSQSNCPLCRANVMAMAHQLPPPETSRSSVVNVNAYENHCPSESILVVGDRHEHVVVVSGVEGVRNDGQYRRSASFRGRQLLISDILKFEDMDECIQVENDHVWSGIGSSSGNRSRDSGLLRSPVAMKRSISTGGKGKNSILPN